MVQYIYKDKHLVNYMNIAKRPFLIIVGVIFAVIALLHAMKAVTGFPAVIAGFSVPLWVSILAIVIAADLSYNAFRLLMKNK